MQITRTNDNSLGQPCWIEGAETGQGHSRLSRLSIAKKKQADGFSCPLLCVQRLVFANEVED